ncbi:addiction module protein [Thiohalorhabdus methylotrophus]|uniref:Addiction module protein n=1 Tax=Thiohalorhabdus methylotrophus TaxID=3242694 RepID=A0ABV4U2J2_9GAMM
MKIEEILEEAASLPVEERAQVVDSLLRSLNPPEAEIDRKWAEEARRRLEEVRSGAAEGVSDQVRDTHFPKWPPRSSWF